MKNYLFLSFFVLMGSCVATKQNTNPPEEIYHAPPVIQRLKPKVSDSVKQKECSKKRVKNKCEKDEDCEEICDDIFSRRSDRQKCYELPEDLVFEFETLIDNTEDGEVEDIDTEVLECMLDIDEREFVKALRKINNREAKEFLFEIVKNEDLAKVLKEEDDEFNILKQLLQNAVGTGLQTALTREIEDDKSFFWLVAEDNEHAWEYFEDYVENECENKNKDCPLANNLGAYCKALVTGDGALNQRDLEDFLSSAYLFADEYEDEIEDEGYEYGVNDNSNSEFGDFRLYCRDVVAGLVGVDQSCPEKNPKAKDKLADFTFVIYHQRNYFVHPSYREPKRGQPVIFRNNASGGSTDPDQDILLYLYRDKTLFLGTVQWRTPPETFIVFDDAEINYDRDKAYYLYIEGNRFELSYTKRWRHNGIDFIEFKTSKIRDNDLSDSSEKAVHFASEEDNLCEFYNP